MPDWTTYLRAGLRHPPHVTARKAIRLAARLWRQRQSRQRDFRTPTYLDAAPPGALRRRIHLGGDEISAHYAGLLGLATENYLAHRFDLLGSGWVEVRHGMACAGLQGYRYAATPAVQADAAGEWLAGRLNTANLSESQRIWRLIRQPYLPIDWQLDFKSGHRWSELTYFLDIRYGDRLGVDVKVPWELARMQHLPQLALACRAARQGRAGFASERAYADAFRNQVLDFIATNPPRFGVNWGCAMDVGIRLVNILIALDLFLDAGTVFDAPFIEIVRRSIVEHGRHVIGNLEWSEEGRGNHYLANVVGLLFAGAYLPRDVAFDDWLAFAVHELIVEGRAQFLPDGGNFEGSLSYHRLSSELLLFGLAVVLGLDRDETECLSQRRLPAGVPPLAHANAPAAIPSAQEETTIPPALFATLAAAARLTRHGTKPTGEITQWGDNDSGRLVKLQPAWQPMDRQMSDAVAAATVYRAALDQSSICENVLDHRAFVAAAAVLIGCDDLHRWAGKWVEQAVASALARGRVMPVVEPSIDRDEVRVSHLDEVMASINRLPQDARRVIEITLDPGVGEDVSRSAYKAFGHYAFAGPRFFLAVRCPHREFGAAAGHAHDDILAVELQVDGKNVLADPGTFVYTPLPQERNHYRAAGAHFVPRPANGGEASIERGLFEIAGVAGARCLFFGPEGFAGEAWGPQWRTMRAVLLRPDKIVIADGCLTGPLAPVLPSEQLPRCCRGYGCKTPHPPRLF